jgi:aminoglycoside phosphotransferase (APT) family kinase protein
MTMQRSSRDAEEMRLRLTGWLTGVLPDGADPAVVLHQAIEENGMSSETVLLDATWSEEGHQCTGQYVARVAPATADFPVFASYDLQHQYDAIRLVGELSDVPVPQVRWIEPTGEVLGTPFFLMDRVEGLVPRDVLPYNFGDNWLFDSSADQQRHLQDQTVAVLSALHAIPDAATTFDFLDPAAAGGTVLARNLAHARDWYDFAVPDIGRSPTAERALSWLEAHVPTTDEAVLCWGDARIGNVLYRDHEPVGVLDWEMATLGPRELDVSWLVFAHQVFESITGMLELPGMPQFLAEDDVVASYEAASGVRLGSLDWYHVYNGLLWCVVFMRTGARQIHFGEIERPQDIETLFHHKILLESVLAKVGA